MILEVLAICLDSLKLSSDHVSRGQKLVEEIAASVPYHLTGDVNLYLSNPPKTSRLFVAGKPVGGLFLLHPFNVVLWSQIVSSELRAYASSCLVWICDNMEIGQAGLLSNVSSPLTLLLCQNLSLNASQPAINLPFQFIANGHMLI